METINGHTTPVAQNGNSRPTVSTASKGKPDMNKKREGYLEWPEYFMAIAFLSAQRSKDPATQVGACIVNTEKKIVGIGYNGMPNGCSDDVLPWGKTSDNPLENKSNTYLQDFAKKLNTFVFSKNGKKSLNF